MRAPPVVALVRTAAIITSLACAAGLVAGATGCKDTRYPRAYPRWKIEPAMEVAWRGCAGVRAFVRKSGKQGIGVALELRSRHDCAVTIPRAELVLDDGTRARGEVLPIEPLRGRSLVYLWMPVRFDGDLAWNRGAARGRLELELAIDGAAQPPIVVPVTQEWSGPWKEPT